MERIENLQKSKEKLNECIILIEDMEQNHQTEVFECKHNIKYIDRRSNTDLRRLGQQHEHKIGMQKGHFSESEKRAQILQRAGHKFEQSNQRQLHETMKEIDMMSSAEGFVHEDFCSIEKGRIKAKRLKDRKLEVVDRFQEKEAVLDEVRMHKNELKKQIAHAKHDIRNPKSALRPGGPRLCSKLCFSPSSIAILWDKNEKFEIYRKSFDGAKSKSSSPE
jgi:hypothetical protein